MKSEIRPKRFVKPERKKERPKHCGRICKKRVNFPFGKNAKPRITYTCRNCKKIIEPEIEKKRGRSR